MVTVLIADDEPLARERLRALLDHEPEFRLVGEATDGLEAVRMLRIHNPTIAILDIRLPGLDAFAVLRALGDRTRPAVILVTAHTDRAVEAFHAGAVDYLLKPFDTKRLRSALQRARAGPMRSRNPAGSSASATDGRIALRSNGRWIVMDSEDIELVLSANIHSEMITRNGVSLPVSESLGQLANRLPSDRFVRISRFAIVNLDAVCSVTPRTHGDQTLELRGGRTLTVSRTHRAEVLHRLNRLP